MSRPYVTSVHEDGEEALIDESHQSPFLLEEEDHSSKEVVGPYRMCIVWCPIPLLTWLCPWVGHLGVGTSTGLLHDFAGPYHINRHPALMAFGRPTKFYRVKELELCVTGSPEEAAQKWDAAVEAASAEYATRMHNLIWDNCHSHVAYALNSLRFKRSTHWNTLTLILFMMFFSHYPSWRHVLQTYLPFVVLLTFFALFFTIFAA